MIEQDFYPDGTLFIETIIHTEGKTEKYYYNNGNLCSERHFNQYGEVHRQSNYAERQWNDNGELTYEGWVINDKNHRIDGPAVKIISGNTTREVWYQNGKHHRVDGPAVIEYFNREITDEEYWIKGNKILKGHLEAYQQNQEIKQVGPYIKNTELEEIWIKYNQPQDAQQSLIPVNIKLFNIEGYRPRLEVKYIPAYLYSESSYGGINYSGKNNQKNLHHFPIAQIESNNNNQTIYVCFEENNHIISIPQHHHDRYSDLIQIGRPPTNKLSVYPESPTSALVLVGSNRQYHLKNFTDTLNLLRYKPEEASTKEFLYTATLGYMGTHKKGKDPNKYLPYAELASEMNFTMNYSEQKQYENLYEISQRQQKLKEIIPSSFCNANSINNNGRASAPHTSNI